ncbi:hypothetical protein MBAV_000661 [Candidatus Magnetobacterium bavaricum]|uniref:Uncharacterized protein n=1 Tax=Candidatus Magnetobacterium bavaricum TaxID=29290 RepID=A0A0F3GZ34_9BACT|nr:hypothetical protein MBAV_000661 [Candidatus Magnetobacterium bavaricum]
MYLSVSPVLLASFVTLDCDHYSIPTVVNSTDNSSYLASCKKASIASGLNPPSKSAMASVLVF